MLKLTYLQQDSNDYMVFSDPDGKLWKVYRDNLCTTNDNSIESKVVDTDLLVSDCEFDIIGMLDHHCGDCGVIDFCPSGECCNYSICMDNRFKCVPQDVFCEIAEKAPREAYGDSETRDCRGDCEKEDCDAARSEDLENLADYVYAELQKRKEGSLCEGQ